MCSFRGVSLVTLGILLPQAAATVSQVQLHRTLPARQPYVSVVADADDFDVVDVADAKMGAGVTYDHMPKAGGTFLIQLLRKAVGSDRFGFVSEFHALSQEDIDTSFVIGSVRNPCDYYLSLWAFGVEHGGAMINSIPPGKRSLYEPRSENKDSEGDIQLFREWVRMINRHGHPGVMSVRFAKSYAWLDEDVKASRPPMALRDDELDAVERALSNQDFMDRVDCWVHVDDMDAGAQRCIRKWEAQTGVTADWKAYNQAFNESSQLTSNHAACSTYFTPKLAEYVQELEAPIFKYFNYRTCCSS